VNEGGDAKNPEPSGEAGVPPEVIAAAQGLAEALDSTDITEAIIEREGVRIRIRRSTSTRGRVAPGTTAQTGSAREEPVSGAHSVRAPLTGIFYRASSPHADPYVREGDWLEPASVIGLIEAMKVYNEVAAETSGRALRFAVETGTHVEAGDTLLEVDPKPA
jgi:biotin carboxyl carrier protein